MKEEWRDIEGYEGYYQVSNLGRVRSLDRVIKNRSYKGVVLNGIKNADGYYTVMLHGKLGSKIHRVNRLVAQAFIPNPKQLPVVDHIDENKTNNRIDNLRWCTNQENSEFYFSKRESTSKYNGVHFDKELKKWVSTTYVDGNQYIIVRTDNEDIAKEARLFAMEYGVERARSKYRRPSKPKARKNFDKSRGKWKVTYYENKKERYLTRFRDESVATNCVDYANQFGFDRAREKYCNIE